MLVRFAGTNIRSFRDSFEISFEATPLSEKQVVRQIPWRTGTGASAHVGVLPVAAIFGANASGKSNVLRALGDMRAIVLNSFRHWTTAGRTRRTPFRLDTRSEHEPSRFEMDLVLGGVLHRYGFTLDDERIIDEWAFRFPKGRPQRIFERTRDGMAFGSSTSAATIRAAELVRDNALFLSTAVAVRGDELRPLYEWFERNLLYAAADNRDSRHFFTAKQLGDGVRRDQVLALLRAADLGIVDVEEADTEAMPDDMREKIEKVLEILNEGEETPVLSELPTPVSLVHEASDGRRIRFALEDESLGTVVWLGLVGPIVDALDAGSVLLADELDASLHPILVEQIVRLFQDPETNPNRAQLIFNSHDAHLLGDSRSARILGRDQVWFTEKMVGGATSLFPLSDLNPRKEEAISKRYLTGRYGAIPIVSSGDFEDATRLATTR